MPIIITLQMRRPGGGDNCSVIAVMYRAGPSLVLASVCKMRDTSQGSKKSRYWSRL